MSYNPLNPNGQATMANSQPVVIASNQTAVTVGNSSVQIVGAIPPQSVSGVGTFNINPVGNGSMLVVQSDPTKLVGTMSVMGVLSVLGTVPVTQSTIPWTVLPTSGSVFSYQAAGSVMAVSGSFSGGNSSVQVVGVMPPQSVSGVGTFNINPVGSGSIIATLVTSSVAVLQGTNPWIVGNSSVQVVGLMPPQSVSGVGTFQVFGSTSIVGVAQPASVSGVGLFNVNHTGNGSVITVGQPASVSGVGLFNVNHTGNGSIITVFSSPSIVGTYSEDSAHTTADKGVFSLNVRNDTLSSITSTDGDYSPMATGPVGEVIVANSPITKWWSAQTSVMYGTSVQAFVAQGASIFTYISGLQIANDSGTFSRVKITGGLGSVLAWTVAPANGGSNIVFANPLKTGENSGISASINGVSSVYITMQGFISKI